MPVGMDGLEVPTAVVLPIIGIPNASRSIPPDKMLLVVECRYEDPTHRVVPVRGDRLEKPFVSAVSVEGIPDVTKRVRVGKMLLVGGTEDGDKYAARSRNAAQVV